MTLLHCYIASVPGGSVAVYAGLRVPRGYGFKFGLWEFVPDVVEALTVLRSGFLVGLGRPSNSVRLEVPSGFLWKCCGN